MTNKEIGEMIKVMRLSRGMTQDQLAKAIGTSSSAVSMYEQGLRKPKDPIIEALADVFNVPKWSITFNEKEMMPIETKEDEELWQIREDFRRNPELRTIHSLTRNATRQELRQVEAFIRAIRSSNEEDTD